jgi:ribulose-phosphate 3-epimerase
MTVEIAPSIIAADYTRLAEALETLAGGGADMVHVDVMDGHFVPNLTIGPDVVRSLAAESTIPLDCHLMIEEPERWIERYAAAGAARISVHAEACRHLHRTVAAIRKQGVAPCVALNPASPLELIGEILPELDGVLIMSVNPGFSGQSFIPSSIEKVARLARIVADRGLLVKIQVDGGVAPDNVATLVRAGATRFVAGSAVFGSGDPRGAIDALKAAAGASA